MCARLGARLCTMQELQLGKYHSHFVDRNTAIQQFQGTLKILIIPFFFKTDYTRGTGCGLDAERVWSSTTEDCPDGRVRTLAGSSLYLTDVPPVCSSQIAERFAVRCCADQYSRTSTPSPTVATSSTSTGACARSDYCLASREPLNRCINLSNGNFSAHPFPHKISHLSNHAFIDGYNAGEHECVCNGRGYVLSADRKTCVAPVNPCSSGMRKHKPTLSLGIFNI